MTMPSPGRVLPVLTTEHDGFTLTELRPRDADDYYDLVQANRAHLTAYGDYGPEVSASRQQVRDDFVAPGDDNLRYGMRLDGELVGRIDLNPVNPPHYVIGYWVSRRHTGRGFATAAGAALIAYARDRLYAHDVVAGVTHGNAPSVGVLRRLGFTPIADRGEYVRYRLVVGPPRQRAN